MKKKKDVVDIQLTSDEIAKKEFSQLENRKICNETKMRLEELIEERRLTKECREFEY